MAKTLKDFLEGYLKVKSADEQKFIDKHVTAKNPDRNGNGDDVFKGSTKTIDRRKTRKGYNPGEDEKVYEELKGGQKKLDKNKNGKLDAEDFKKLRKEEAEELEELSTDTLRNYRNKARDDAFDAADVDDDRRLRKRSFGANQAGKKILKRGDTLRKEEAEQIDELDQKLGGTLSRYINKTKDNPKREAGRNLALKKRWGDAKYGTPEPKVKAAVREDVEELEESAKVAAHLIKRYGENVRKSHVRSAANDFGVGYVALAHAVRKKLGVNRLEEEQIEEAGYSAAAARAGKDLGKPGKQFSKIANKAAAKYGSKERGEKVAGAVLAKLRKEEKLAELIGDLTESHKRTMTTVFEKLNDVNKTKFLEACETPEGVDQMLDFAINHRGE